MLNLSHWMLDYYHPEGYLMDVPVSEQYWILLFKQPLIFRVCGELLEIPTDHCVFFTPGAPRYYLAKAGGYYHDGLFFKGDNLMELAASIDLPCNVPFPVKNPGEIAALIREITEETLFPQPHTPQIIDLRIRLLMHRLADSVCTGVTANHQWQQPFFALRKALFQRPEQLWDAESAAQSLHISLSRFHHLYKELFHTTWKQDLIRSRVSHAKYLLRSSSDSANQIAATCGYKNTEHFFRQFKKQTGLTPTEYRQKHRLPVASPEIVQTSAIK